LKGSEEVLEAMSTSVARHLAICALNRRRTTYPELARAVGWAHPTGRGLGRHLKAVLDYVYAQGLPCLTTILVEAGSSGPPARAVEYIRDVYGEIDVAMEQTKVLGWPWAAEAWLELESDSRTDIDFSRIFATRTWGFDPENWGMTCFTTESERDRALERMQGQPVYVVYFCGPQTERVDGQPGRFTIQLGDVARVLGIVEVQPTRATHDTHTAQPAREAMIRDWGRYRWPFGLINTRAWEFVDRPWTKEALPTTRSGSWPVTRGIVPVTTEEAILLERYRLRELPVFGQLPVVVSYGQREAMHTTYLAICDDPATLAKTSAPAGTKLVKIGVSGDTQRRLHDLNDHHFARIFGIEFRMEATRRWASQNEALGREARALEWAADVTLHASGEYFFMTNSQISEALMWVKSDQRALT
jgi:hypothetical protein